MCGFFFFFISEILNVLEHARLSVSGPRGPLLITVSQTF